MNQTIIKNKITVLEAEVALLKKTFVREPDFAVDEKNWKKIKPTAKKIRKQVYKEAYE